jgi:hypothetical protein
MKPMFSLLFALASVLFCGCASSPDFTPYVGKQAWPQSPGSFVETKYTVPIYYGWPDKPYIVLGVITTEGNNIASVARFAKLHGADALIYRKTLTGNAGTYTTPGHATSFTSGNFANDQYSGITTTTYSPGVSVPLVVSVTAYNAIKWEDPLQAKADILRNTLDWANAHPDGGNYVDGKETSYFSAQQVQDLKNSIQEQLNDLQSPLNSSQAQAEVDALRSTLDWLNAHPDGGTYGEGQNAISFKAREIQDAKLATQRQLDGLLSHLNQSAQTNSPANSVSH